MSAWEYEARKTLSNFISDSIALTDVMQMHIGIPPDTQAMQVNSLHRRLRMAVTCPEGCRYASA